MAVAVRYVNRELISIFAVTLALLLLVAVGGRFIGYLQEAASGKLTGGTVLVIMFYRLPEFVQLICPFALYVAILLTISRLHADREMVVLQGAGVGTGRLLAWIGVSASVIVALVAVLTTVATPQANYALDEYLTVQRAASQFDTVKPEVFQISQGGRRVNYSAAVSVDRRMLSDVFIAEELGSPQQVTIWAKAARQKIDPETGSQFLVFYDGHRNRGAIGHGNFQTLKFAELSQRLDNTEAGAADHAAAAKPTLMLGGEPADIAEWHWRFGLPVFCAIGGLLALSLARVKPRQGRFAKVLPGMSVMFFYYLLLLVNRNALSEGILPEVYGLWLVHGAFALIALVLLSRVGRPVAGTWY